MTKNHAEALKTAFPDQAQKVYLLSEMVGKKYDIQDPYGGSRLEYAYTARELENLIDSGYERIVTLAEESPV
jgi:protein-tyrosine-phosphatase